jgi:hypothetical protein
MAGTAWNIAKLDEGYIRPQVMVGAVVMNGAVHQNLCNQARREQAPYWPKAASIHSNNQEKISHGDIVFTLTKSHPSLNMGNNITNAIRLQGVAILNGHGKDGHVDGNEIFMDNITVLGIAEVPKTPNNQGFFNLIRGGILTVRNNSMWTIQPGDYLSAYAPSRAELPNCGAGLEADKYGEAKLCFKKYDPLVNSLTGKSIYRALTSDNKSGHLPRYLETCQALLKSIKSIAMITMGACFKKIKSTVEGAPHLTEQAFLSTMMKEMDDNEDDLVDKLFVLYSDSMMHKLDKAGLPTSPINKAQREGIDQFLRASAQLQHYVFKNVKWQAMTYADPKKNMSVQCIDYAG